MHITQLYNRIIASLNNYIVKIFKEIEFQRTIRLLHNCTTET